MLARDKHRNLLNPFINYEENKVFVNTGSEVYLHYITSFLTTTAIKPARLVNNIKSYFL